MALPALLLISGIALYAASGQHFAGAAEILSDGGFETWTGPWQPTGDVSQVASPSVAGSALRLTAPATVRHQAVEAVGGGTYTLSVAAEAEASGGAVSLEIGFLDADLLPVGGPGGGTRTLSTAFSVVSGTAVAHAGAAYVAVALRVTTPGAVVYVDDASLVESLPPPTPTPTPTAADTPTATPTDGLPAATPTEPIGSDPTTAPGQPTATRTPTPKKTGTPTRTPTVPKSRTATKTPTPRKAPTATKTPTSTPPSADPSGLGGMLVNGGFETADGGKPAFWSKFGGTMALSDAARSGEYAASLESDTTSTKWLYQVVPIAGEAWYEVDGFARVEGMGEAFVRASWYASDDGSGSAIGQADSESTADAEWSAISNNRVQAPSGAGSARVRLMLRPDSDAVVSAFFDDMEMYPTDAPPPEPTDAAGSPTDVVAGVSTVPGGTTPRAGNGFTATGTTAAGQTPNATLRLSEFMSDPEETGRDSAYEWVELVNIGTAEANTAGWEIGDGAATDPLPAVAIPAGGYVLVAARSAVLPDGVAAVRIDDGEIGGGLNNTGDVIRLIAPDGSAVDTISYGDNSSVFDPAPPAPAAAMTLGVRDPTSDPDGANWALTDRPTPGEPNSFAGARAKPAAAPQATAVAAAPAPASAGTVFVERRGDGSGTLQWIIIGTLALAVAALGAFVLRDPIAKLIVKKP